MEFLERIFARKNHATNVGIGSIKLVDFPIRIIYIIYIHYIINICYMDHAYWLICASPMDLIGVDCVRWFIATNISWNSFCVQHFGYIRSFNLIPWQQQTSPKWNYPLWCHGQKINHQCKDSYLKRHHIFHYALVPLQGTNISHPGKFGKSSTQTCRLGRDMWEFPGG